VLVRSAPTTFHIVDVDDFTSILYKNVKLFGNTYVCFVKKLVSIAIVTAIYVQLNIALAQEQTFPSFLFVKCKESIPYQSRFETFKGT
jgi:hypothetical protein